MYLSYQRRTCLRYKPKNKKKQMEKELKKLGLEVYNTSAGTVASICGVREILAYWESLDELLNWAYDKTGDQGFLNLMEA